MYESNSHTKYGKAAHAVYVAAFDVLKRLKARDLDALRRKSLRIRKT
jgi:hypothetical protein